MRPGGDFEHPSLWNLIFLFTPLAKTGRKRHHNGNSFERFHFSSSRSGKVERLLANPSLIGEVALDEAMKLVEESAFGTSNTFKEVELSGLAFENG